MDEFALRMRYGWIDTVTCRYIIDEFIRLNQRGMLLVTCALRVGEFVLRACVMDVSLLWKGIVDALIDRCPPGMWITF